jgi:hypothetical protein
MNPTLAAALIQDQTRRVNAQIKWGLQRAEAREVRSPGRLAMLMSSALRRTAERLDRGSTRGHGVPPASHHPRAGVGHPYPLSTSRP